MSDDKIDNLLMVGASFDWITPLLNMVQGYNQAVKTGCTFEEAWFEQMRLQEKGIKSRIEGNLSSYRVVVKGGKVYSSESEYFVSTMGIE